MDQDVEELRAVLAAYHTVAYAAWPQLHPTMPDRATLWPSASGPALRSELQEYVQEASAPGCPVRLFWKVGPSLVFGGCNAAFAQDAGLPTQILLGLDDYDPRLPWARQAAKYRLDDKEIIKRGTADLEILERHTAADGTVQWVRAAKAPIRTAAGSIVGVLGMYEMLDADTGRRRFAEQQLQRRAK